MQQAGAGYAVPPCLLGLIQGTIGTRNQVVCIVANVHCCHAARDADCQHHFVGMTIADLHGFGALPYGIGEGHAFFQRAIGQ